MERPRLLIVDSQDESRRLLERMLSGQGFRVTAASDAKAAGAALVREVFELVLLDLRLADGDGLDLCRRIKADPATADVPVMLIASDARSPELLARALAAGACDCLVKPFSRVDVLAHVRCAIHHRMELLRLQQLDMHDKLTGLPGRTYFLSRLDEELSESQRFSSPVSLILADVSELRAVYDQQGAVEGDRWVERFGLLVRSECRTYDVVARLHDYRFALMLPRVSGENAVKAARRLSETWRLTTLEAGGLDFYVPARMAVEQHAGHVPAPSGGDLLNRALTSLERAIQDQAGAGDPVRGPSADPYAVSIWSDYLVDAPPPSV